jgi:hypothetical protein
MSIWGRDWVQDEMQPANTKIEVCGGRLTRLASVCMPRVARDSLTAHSARTDLKLVFCHTFFLEFLDCRGSLSHWCDAHAV